MSSIDQPRSFMSFFNRAMYVFPPNINFYLRSILVQMLSTFSWIRQRWNVGDADLSSSNSQTRLGEARFFSTRSHTPTALASQSAVRSASQSASKPAYLSVRQSDTQLPSQPADQSVSRPFTQPVIQPASQTKSWSVRQAGRQAVNQSVSQPISHSVSDSHSFSQPVS